MQLAIPGKTYLVGEYSVLLGGSALGLATQPCFKVEFNVAEDKKISFHPESPAALYLKKHQQNISVAIQDPYVGGFGRSTAEYMAAVFSDLIRSSEKISFHDLLKEYKSLHNGSGIDLAFQFFGQVCLADPIIQYYQTLDWHLSNLDFYILATGLKVPTHEHIRSLDLSKLKELPALSDKITKVYVENKEFEFLSLLRQWCEMLEKHSLTHSKSLELRKKLESCAEIKLAKPCGALGADVILVFFAKNQKETVKEFLINNKFNIQAHSSDLVQGVYSQVMQFRKNGSLHVD